jgi:cysteine desulfurase / selenocysteine lyase
LYPIAEKASTVFEEVRSKVARFIGARDSSEIIFTKNATEAINFIAYTWGNEYVHNNTSITTTVMEHHANFVPWQELAFRKKARFNVVDITDNGDMIMDELNSYTRDSSLLAVTYVSNMLGNVNPVKKIINDVKKENQKIKILVDASQSAPHMKIDVVDLDCDFMVFTGHKMLAETGVGVLYIKRELHEKIPPFLFGGDMIEKVAIERTTYANSPQKFEAGTPHVSGVVSLGAAIDYMDCIGMSVIEKHSKDLAWYCIERLIKIDGINVYGPQELKSRSSIISFSLDDIHPHDISQVLADENICVRAGHHCAMPLHTRLNVPATVRISFHIYNDQEDVERLIRGIKELKKIFSL